MFCMMHTLTYCTYTHTRTHTHARTHVRTHTHTHTQEEPHEWGVRTPGTEIHPLEAAPRKWRQLLAERKVQTN